jgi:TolB protein
VIFASDRDGNLEIYSVDVGGKGERNLTVSSMDEFSPVVSPDRQRVGFLSGSGDNIALEVMLAEGAGRQKLAGEKGKHRSHRWSPDSSRIAYVLEDGGEMSIHVTNVDEGQPMLLTAIHGDEVGSWSPNGRWVAFAVTTGAQIGIHTRNPDGVNEFRLTDTPDFSPMWSPDSERIAFLSKRDGASQIFVMKADGSEQRKLTEGDAPKYHISWSPNGKVLLFVSERDGNPEIHVVDVDEGNEVRLTHNDARDEQPVWSPDGRKIAFVSYLDGDAEIFLMDADGSNQVRLTSNDYLDTSPSW